MPRIARIAVILLWVAWTISAYMVLARAVRLGGLDMAALFGVAGLLVQALIFFFVGRGSNSARIALFVVILLGLPALLVLVKSELDFSRLPTSSIMTCVGLALRVFACILLFTPGTRFWFSRRQMTVSAPDL
jgi:hypothetical protein